MQSFQQIESKPLIKFKYVEYKRQIEQTLSDIFIPKEIIPRHTVEDDKRLFGEAFQNHDISKDHMFGCQMRLKKPPTPSGREYDNSNNWGKTTLRMVGILKTLQPEMFFDFKRKGNSLTSVKTFNPFIDDNDDRQVGNHKEGSQKLTTLADNSIDPDPPKPTVDEVQKMKKAELEKLYVTLHGVSAEQKTTVAKLKELIISKLIPNVPMTADTSAEKSSTSASNQETNYTYAAQVLSRYAFNIIQHSVDYLDITTILAKYNIDGDVFLSSNETAVHPYYKARMLHAAILNELLPSKIADVRHKFLLIQDV